MRYLYQTYACRDLGYMGSCFLRTLNQHPELQSHVRHILLEYNQYSTPGSENSSKHDLSMSKNKLRAEAQQMFSHGTRDYDAMLHVLREHPEEVELALTIYHTRHSLERLERVKRSESDWALPWLSALTRPSFTKLQYLEVDMGGILGVGGPDMGDMGDTGGIELKDIVRVCTVSLVTHIYKVIRSFMSICADFLSPLRPCSYRHSRH
jgi:hypothetical protein